MAIISAIDDVMEGRGMMKRVLPRWLLLGLSLAAPLAASAAPPMDGNVWETIDQDDQAPRDSALDGWVPGLVAYLNAAGSPASAVTSMGGVPNHYLYRGLHGIGPDAAVMIAFLLTPDCARPLESPHPTSPARCAAAQLIVSWDARTITRVPRLPMCIVRPDGATATQMRYDARRRRIVFRTMIDGVERPDCNYFITYPDPHPR